MRNIFIGANGIRAGWRFAMYVAIFVGLLSLMQIAGSRIWHLHKPTGPLTPMFALVADLFLLVPMLIAAFIMSRIERRPMGAYGLPLRAGSLPRALAGALIGFLSLTVVLGLMLAAGGVRFSGPSVTASLILDGVAFLAAFVAVGLAEEFLFRGYAQYVLTQGIGFWPAAGLLSLGFAAAHISNSGESVLGVAQVAMYGLVFCYVLKATGSLWFAVGYHAAWDWGESYLYGVPDSGQLASVSALHGSMLGPAWLSGGSDGPEGSILTTVILLALVPVVWRRYASQRFAGSSIHER